jgi:hypothetical protein
MITGSVKNVICGLYFVKCANSRSCMSVQCVMLTNLGGGHATQGNVCTVGMRKGLR